MTGILNCTATKLNHPAKACELYSASSIFRRNYKHIKLLVDRVLILSAKHYVLEADQMVKPYDMALANMGEEEYAAWCDVVYKRLRGCGPFIAIVANIYRGGLKCLPDAVTYLPISKYGAVRNAYRGVGVTDLVRWMASQRWSSMQVRAVLAAMQQPMSKGEVQKQYRNGQLGKGLPELDVDMVKHLAALRRNAMAWSNTGFGLLK